MKLCLYFNIPSYYRKAIYQMIDKEYDCDWYFENTINTIKQFDTNLINTKKKFPVTHIGPFVWTNGLLRLLFDHQYQCYFLLGETRNISIFLFLVLKKLFFRKKKIYFWTHGFYGKESKLELLWKTSMFRMPDGLFVYGEYAKKIMVKLGFDSKRIYPIYNSLNYEEQLQIRRSLVASSVYKEHFGNDCPVLIFIGRLTEVKRLDMILQSVSLLKQRGCIYNVVIVGDGEKREELNGLSQTLNITEYVWFYGECYDERQNAELLYNADLCIAPGNIGLTAMHALMFGCPAMSHDDSKMQMPEFEAIIEDKTGSFFSYGSKESMADSIDNWFKSHKSDRQTIRQNCFSEIDKHWNPYYQMEIIRKNLILNQL